MAENPDAGSIPLRVVNAREETRDFILHKCFPADKRNIQLEWIYKWQKC